MRKENLRTGMIVEFQDGCTSVVMLKTEDGDWLYGDIIVALDCYDDGLNCNHIDVADYEIVAVHRPKHGRGFKSADVPIKECIPLWRKPAEKPMKYPTKAQAIKKRIPCISMSRHGAYPKGCTRDFGLSWHCGDKTCESCWLGLVTDEELRKLGLSLKDFN